MTAPPVIEPPAAAGLALAVELSESMCAAAAREDWDAFGELQARRDRSLRGALSGRDPEDPAGISMGTLERLVALDARLVALATAHRDDLRGRLSRAREGRKASRLYAEASR